MDPTCPRCGSDAAVTWTTDTDGTRYTCRFSHNGEGPVSWFKPARAVRAPAAPRSTTPRAPRAPRTPAAPRAPRATAADRATPAAAAPAPRPSVNDRGVAAVVAEVTRRGGHARVVNDGTKHEVVVTGDGAEGEVRLTVRTRIGGSWQTKASYGEPMAEDENPTTFWVLVHLAFGKALCYVVPEWWIRNDISEKHDEYLRSRSGSVSDSDHHSIGTGRVEQWQDRWDQLPVLHEAP